MVKPDIQYSEYNDYELVKNILENSDPKVVSYYKTILFFKYTNFLHKRFNKFKFKYYYDFEDFQSIAFFYFEKSLQYINLDLIYDKKNWKFLGIYMYFINNLISSLKKEVFKYNANTVSLEKCYNISSNINSDEIIQKIDLENRLKNQQQLDVEEKKVIEYILNNNNVKNIYEISKNTNVTFYKVKKIVNSLQC